MNVGASQRDCALLKYLIRIRTRQSECHRITGIAERVLTPIGFKYRENEEHEVKYSHSIPMDAL